MSTTPCECVIPNGGYCPRHAIQKPAHWVHLCQTKPKYYAAWESGHGPGQPQPQPPSTVQRTAAYLLCPYRGDILTTISGRTAGCGCASSRVHVYHCTHFDEPILQKSPPRCLPDIVALVPAYTGRTCHTCTPPPHPPTGPS